MSRGPSASVRSAPKSSEELQGAVVFRCGFHFLVDILPELNYDGTKLETAAGAGDAARGRRLASTWYVWPAPIFRRRWRALIVDDLECDMTTGAPYPMCNECCDTLVHGDAVEDPETGDSFHAECLAYRRSENSRE